MSTGRLRFGILVVALLGIGTPMLSEAQEETAGGGGTGMVLPESGETEGFTYSRSSQHEGMYEVRLGGQDSQPVYVADSTLGLLLSSPVPVGVQSAFVSQYPYQMLNMYEHVLNTYYPDDQEDYRDDPFPAWQGGGVSVDQDTMAPNYVRVRMPDENGNMQEFSISRRSMDEIFDLEMEAAIFADAVKEFPYRLPEQVRVNFNYLTREQMIAQIEQEPAMARQEFTQVKRIYFNSPAEDGVDTSVLQEPALLTEEASGEYGRDAVMPPIVPAMSPVSEVKRAGSSEADIGKTISPPDGLDAIAASNRRVLVLMLALAVAVVVGTAVVIISRRR